MPRLHRTAPLLLLGLLAACASDGGKKRLENAAPQEFTGIQEQTPDPIGKFLADADLRIRAWTRLTMTARSVNEQRQARELGAVLERETGKRIDELIAALETGPARNRQRAAAALGFTKDPAALAPLLAALEDSDPDVVHNAALGLALLAQPETPPEALLELLTEHPDPETRTMAAYALCAAVQAGADPQPMIPTVRLALLDTAPGVRLQCALIAGLAADGASAQRLADLLYDEQMLVRYAAIEGLVQLGKRSGPDKGTAARALVDAWVEANSRTKPRLREGMAKLAGQDLGSDEDRWVRWSRNLP